MIARLLASALLLAAHSVPAEAARRAPPGASGSGGGAVVNPGEGEAFAPPVDTRSCDAHAVQYAIGERPTPALLAEIENRSGARMLRVIPHGGAATRDFRSDRLNVQLDKRNRIAVISCG